LAPDTRGEVRSRTPNMTEEMPPQVLPTATGFAAREALAMLRKRNIATAPLLLRAGLSGGARFLHPAPPHVRSPGRKRPDRARVTAAERGNGRGPSNGNNDIELPSTSISHLLLLFGRGIFWRDGFRPIISCQRPPRPPQGPGRVFRAPIGAFSAFPVARQAARPRCRIHQIEFSLKRSPRPRPPWPRGRSLHGCLI
jgi:hypothetical protein